MRVVVLGHTGLLGHMVYKYLSTKDDCELITTESRWPSDEFRNFVLDFNGDFVVNCIGAIHQRTSEFGVNTDLTILLDELNKDFKIIHPGTDCEIDDDDYGISKREAADYLLTEGKDTTIIKTSIIGPELNTQASLLEWFLDQKEEIFGYTKAMWNGNTTLQWAKQCLHLMKNWRAYSNIEILEGEGWQFQLENCLPWLLKKGMVFDIKKEEFHRLIRGVTPLKCRIYKHGDSTTTES